MNKMVTFLGGWPVEVNRVLLVRCLVTDQAAA